MFLCAGQHHPVDAAAGGADAADGAGQQEHRQHGAGEQVRRGHQAIEERHRLCRQPLPVIFLQISIILCFGIKFLNDTV